MKDNGVSQRRLDGGWETPEQAARRWKRLAEDLARDVISMAETGGMPDTFKDTDYRMVRAKDALDWDPYAS